MKTCPTIFLVLFSVTCFGQVLKMSLNSNWDFRGTDTLGRMTATVPGTVHTDLFANGITGDPFKDNNEIAQQWIEKENWEYLTVFSVDQETLNKKHHELYFKGLDTYADVYLNDSLILEANNMFRSWRVDVTGILNKEGNVLNIVFTSPINKNDSIARNYLKLPAGSDTTEFPVGPFTRKAAYHFGWDWAPRFVTCGIWKEITLESWSSLKLDNVYYQTSSLDSHLATLTAWISIKSDKKQNVEAFINEDTMAIQLDTGWNHHSHSILIDEPKLWWPNGSGNQHLYNYDFGIINKDGEARFLNSQKIGFREVELVNEPDSIGTSFFFKVNGQPIFIKGANYVPQDVFLPRVKPEGYKRLLLQVKQAGVNMLRVWGGGVYERDTFYDLCDEYGILVWQDFMFAGTMYPNDSSFIDNIELEAYEHVTRLRKHPCLALWCGNNEIEVAWKNWGWQEQFGYSLKDSLNLWSSYINLFDTVLRAHVEIIDARTPYVSTSPQSNWGTAENFNHGSMHYWGVWHGDDDFSDYEKNVGRFMVEWGFQSYPDYNLLKEYISPEYLNLENDIMANRQKSYVGNYKILEQVGLNPKYSASVFQEFVLGSQEAQAEAYEIAIKAHLRSQPHCMGTLLWQLNDCWPGPSWSIINYNGKPKPAYEKVKDALR